MSGVSAEELAAAAGGERAASSSAVETKDVKSAG